MDRGWRGAGDGQRDGSAARRVSGRDVEVLGFVARFGVVPRSAVAKWAGTARTATAVREKRLREAGLLEVTRPWLGPEPVLVATGEGLVTCGRPELAKARVSPRTLRHFAVAAHLAVELERVGEQLLSERELLAHERAMGERDFSIRLRGEEKYHRPDLIVLGEPPTVIEVELTAKGRNRLDEILTGWKTAVEKGRFARVRYYCSSAALPYVKRSVERADAAEEVTVEALCPTGASLPPPIYA
jgi:hypothetical protein